MYTYKLKDNLFYDESKVYFVDDDLIFLDPLEYFSSENVLWWTHRNDETFVIDLDSLFIFNNINT